MISEKNSPGYSIGNTVLIRLSKATLPFSTMTVIASSSPMISANMDGLIDSNMPPVSRA